MVEILTNTGRNLTASYAAPGSVPAEVFAFKVLVTRPAPAGYADPVEKSVGDATAAHSTKPTSEDGEE